MERLKDAAWAFAVKSLAALGYLGWTGEGRHCQILLGMDGPQSRGADPCAPQVHRSTQGRDTQRSVQSVCQGTRSSRRI